MQDFQRRELLVERRRLGYVGDTATRLCLAGRAAVQAHLALIVVDHIEHDLDGGGLAGTVGADEAEHLALAHTEANLAQRLHGLALGLEGLADALKLQRCTHDCSSIPAIFSFFRTMRPSRNS
ncbi:hypothetical protein D3C85_863310 [compost metagenome]